MPGCYPPGGCPGPIRQPRQRDRRPRVPVDARVLLLGAVKCPALPSGRSLDTRSQGRLPMHRGKQRHGEGDEMSSGAYAIPIDPSAGGGPGGTIQRVVPLPPVGHHGAISFSDGWLSLAYGDFGAGLSPVGVRVRIFNATLGVTLDTTMQFPVGRTVVKRRIAVISRHRSSSRPPVSQAQSGRPCRRSWSSTTDQGAFGDWAG